MTAQHAVLVAGQAAGNARAGVPVGLPPTAIPSLFQLLLPDSRSAVPAQPDQRHIWTCFEQAHVQGSIGNHV